MNKYKYPILERVDTEIGRFYKDSKLNLVPSVTTVLSNTSNKADGIADWRLRVGDEEANRVTKAATTRGTDFHTLTEHHLLNDEKLPKVPPISNFLFSVAKQKIGNINNIYALEGSLYSRQLGIAGTVDCIAEYEDELAIIDFKTSKKPKPRDWIEHYFVQCMAYGCMLYELTGISVKKLVIIMSCENGECIVYEEYNKAKYIKLLGEYINKFVQDKLEIYGTE